MPGLPEGTPEPGSSGRRSTTRLINVSRPGQATSVGSVGLIVSMVMRPAAHPPFDGQRVGASDAQRYRRGPRVGT